MLAARLPAGHGEPEHATVHGAVVASRFNRDNRVLNKRVRPWRNLRGDSRTDPRTRAACSLFPASFVSPQRGIGTCCPEGMEFFRNFARTPPPYETLPFNCGNGTLKIQALGVTGCIDLI